MILTAQLVAFSYGWKLVNDVLYEAVKKFNGGGDRFSFKHKTPLFVLTLGIVAGYFVVVDDVIQQVIRRFPLFRAVPHRRPVRMVQAPLDKHLSLIKPVFRTRGSGGRCRWRSSSKDSVGRCSRGFCGPETMKPPRLTSCHG